MDPTALSSDDRPHLPRGVRLRHDDSRGQWTLLAPERVLQLDAVAAEVLKRCTGQATLAEIVSDLATTFRAEPSRIETDVRTMLADLHDKKVVVL